MYRKLGDTVHLGAYCLVRKRWKQVNCRFKQELRTVREIILPLYHIEKACKCLLMIEERGKETTVDLGRKVES